jgi:Tfp pilus assembly major pilin PilA
MLARYSHIRMEAKREALETIARRRNGSSSKEPAPHTTEQTRATETRGIVN